MAGLTDILDYQDYKIMHEFDYELDDEIVDINHEENEKNPNEPRTEFQFRMPESLRLQKRIKNRYAYIGGMPLSKCNVETIPVIQSILESSL
jgi:hypothetical protein